MAKVNNSTMDIQVVGEDGTLHAIGSQIVGIKATEINDEILRYKSTGFPKAINISTTAGTFEHLILDANRYVFRYVNIQTGTDDPIPCEE